MNASPISTHARVSLLGLCLSLLLQGGVTTWGADLVPPGTVLEELWNEGDFTEGVAVGPDGRIYFSDISSDPSASGAIHAYDPATHQVSLFSKASGKSNGVMFDRQGRLIACCGANNGRLALCEVGSDGSMVPLVSRYQGKRFASPNDLVIHAKGWIYFSDPRYVGDEPMEVEQMHTYLYDPSTRKLRAVTTEDLIEKPNGLALSPDQRILYVAETNNGSRGAIETNPHPTQGRMTLSAFDVLDDGSLARKRVLKDFGQESGIDGMTVDTDGRIYAAVRSAARFGIVVYSPEGHEVAYLPTPTLPTNCCFGTGPESRRLYITAGGGLYRVKLEATGFHPALASR